MSLTVSCDFYFRVIEDGLSAFFCVFSIINDLLPSGKYPNLGPNLHNVFHQILI